MYATGTIAPASFQPCSSSVRLRLPRIPGRLSVRVSSSPSRSEPAAPGKPARPTTSTSTWPPARARSRPAPACAGSGASRHRPASAQHRRGQRIAVGEMRVGRTRQLGLPVGATRARPPDRDPTAAEDHLPGLVAMTHRDPIGVLPALRADHLDDLFLHQLGQHTEPDTDAQRQQPLPRGPRPARPAPPAHERATRPPSRSRPARPIRSSPRRFLLFDLGRIAPNAPNRSARGRRDRRLKFYEPRTTSGRRRFRSGRQAPGGRCDGPFR